MLAGGRSSRFGTDKAVALWRGRALLDHAIAALTPHCAAVVVVGRHWDGLARVDDAPRPDLGPLGGIAGALEYSEIRHFDSVITIACDMPDVRAEVLVALAEYAPSYCPDAPVLGHWPASLANDLFVHLSHVAPAEAGAAGLLGHRSSPKQSGPGLRRGDGRLSVRRWAEAIRARQIPAPGLRNVNYLGDLTP